MFGTLRDDQELTVLIKGAMDRYHAMTPRQQAAMWRKQRESWAKAQAELGRLEDAEVRVLPGG